MKKVEKYSSIHYHNYLELEQILGAQKPRSYDDKGEFAHEEMLFIVTHQVYELWFKQLIHELLSVNKMFADNYVNENNLGTCNARLDRTIEILKLLVQQIGIMETMTPLDFLDFRDYLFPASGFQSYQFRMIEVLLGLKSKQRVTYNNKPYTSEFTEMQKNQLEAIEKDQSMFDAVEKWLERTPFLEFEGFDFLKHYKVAVEHMVEREEQLIQSSSLLDDEQKAMRTKMLGDTNTYYKQILDEDHHNKMREEGSVRLSHKALVAALLINLYREEPILQQPYNLLMKLTEIDELITSWRYRHAQMVMRMLGNKIGTGGSSGHEYLLKTAFSHSIFKDYHNVSTMLIPRSELPVLPPEVKKGLGFYYGS